MLSILIWLRFIRDSRFLMLNYYLSFYPLAFDSQFFSLKFVSRSLLSASSSPAATKTVRIRDAKQADAGIKKANRKNIAFWAKPHKINRTHKYNKLLIYCGII